MTRTCTCIPVQFGVPCHVVSGMWHGSGCAWDSLSKRRGSGIHVHHKMCGYTV